MTTPTLSPDDSIRPRPRRWMYLLLLLPFIATLWPPFYNQMDPKLGGIPYFYWYQLLWVPLSAVLTGIVFLTTGRAR